MPSEVAPAIEPAEIRVAEPAQQTVEPARADASNQVATVATSNATGPATKDVSPRDVAHGPHFAEAAAPLSIDQLTFPEKTNRNAAEAKSFIEILNDGKRSTKERGQGLLDLHSKDIARVHQEATRQQRKAFDEINRTWRDELSGDREIGRKRLQTSLSKAKGLIQQYLPAKDAQDLLKHVDANGMGNFPPMVRLLVRIADRLKADESAKAASEKSASAKRQSGPGSRGWYDRSIDRRRA
jgi:hypothetical protein